MAYIAAGQFAIHLADTRLQGELSQIHVENEHRAERIMQEVERLPAGSPKSLSDIISQTERAIALELPRGRLHREMQAFLNGVPIAADSWPTRQNSIRPPAVGDGAAGRALRRIGSRLQRPVPRRSPSAEIEGWTNLQPHVEPAGRRRCAQHRCGWSGGCQPVAAASRQHLERHEGAHPWQAGSGQTSPSSQKRRPCNPKSCCAKLGTAGSKLDVGIREDRGSSAAWNPRQST